MAWNDPQWGKKNDGPPDLDQIWRNFNLRLNKLLGGKPNPAKPSVTPPVIAIAVVLVLVIWLASGFYMVDTDERGVIFLLGKYDGTSQPGPGWHLPYPIGSVEMVNVDQERTVEVGYRDNVRNRLLKESLMLTSDENIVDIQFAVQYTLKDPEAYLFNNRSPDDAVRQVAESVMSGLVGKSPMDYVLYQGRADIAERAGKQIQDVLDQYHTGISVSKVTLQNAQPPQEVQASFDDAVKAGQDEQRLKSEAQAYANDVLPKARGVAASLQEQAAGYKQSVIADAQGEADRFKQVLVQYDKAPAVTRDRMYFDTMQQILSHTTKVLIDSSKGSNQMIYLPLDKLIQQSATTPPAAAITPAPAATPSAGTSNPPTPVVMPPGADDGQKTDATPAGKTDDNSSAEDSIRTRESLLSRNRENRP